MPTKQKTAAKPPLDPYLKKVTLSIPTALLADIDAFALKAGLSRVLVHRELDKRPVLLRDPGHIPSLRLL